MFREAGDGTRTPKLVGKVLIDATNPVGPGVTHGLGSRTSGSQTIQELVPQTRASRASSVYGPENLKHTFGAEGSRERGAIPDGVEMR